MSEASHNGTGKPDPNIPPLFRVINNLMDMNVAVAELATYDPLTGTLNGTAIEDKAQEIMDAGRPMVLTMMDMDAFKKVNDELSHTDGDIILRNFGAYLMSKFRRTNDAVGHVSRKGGDEWMTLMDLGESEDSEDPDHERRADNAIDFVENTVAEFVESQSPIIRKLGFRVSSGHAVFDPNERDPYTGSIEDLDSLVRRADKDMYLDKANNSR